MSNTDTPDFSPKAKEPNKDPLKSPMLFVALGILLIIALFNFFAGDTDNDGMSKRDVTNMIDDYITNNPDKIASANIEAIIKQYITENEEEIKAKITQGPQQAELNKLIEQYIMENPQTLISSVEKWQSDQVLAQRMKAAENIKQKQQELYFDSNTPAIGNTDGNINVVEFFDYNCGYCKRAHPVIEQLLEADDNIRISFKEYPILSAASEKAAKAALAVHVVAPDKYLAFHDALMTSSGSKNESDLLALAENLGIDTNKVKTEMESAAISDMLAKNRNLAKSIGINGTPAFVIGETLVPGAASFEELQRVIEEERKKLGS